MLPMLRLLSGPVAALAIAAATWAADLPTAQIWTAAITALCAAWWLLEPVPIAVTSLVPFALLPLAGVDSARNVAGAFGDDIVLLLMGGFMLSRAVEKSGVHRRLAIGMVAIAGGGSARRLVLGFMLATAVISMWISNTASTLMMMPVALAVIGDDERSRLASPLLLGIAWAASIGGMGTPIGTPPNLICITAVEKATGSDISFLEWMRYAVPMVVVILPIAWWLVVRRLGGLAAPRIEAAGRWSAAEVRVLVVFAITALAWTFRTAPLGGWSHLIGVPGASDATIAVAAVLLLHLLPDGDGGRLLDWETAVSIPWGLLLLFGGGLALGEAFKTSGLAASMGDGLQALSGLPTLLLAAIVCISVTLASEVASNTALANLLMPVMAVAASAAGMAPTRLMMTTALAASCGFMLPIATAPNAIVVGTGKVDTGAMARLGLILDFAGALTIALGITLL